MQNPPEPEEHYEWGGYDDAEEDDPYAEFVAPLVALFDRAQAAFDYADQQLAREAYAALFGILDKQDDYGRGISTSDLTGVDISEAWARYLRAVYETEPAADRPTMIFSEMLTVRTWVAGARPKLDDLIQISPAPLPGRDKFLADWIAFLRGQPGEEADTWLREAIRLAHGTAGLEALARGEGKQRPRAYLDWFTALAQEGKHREVLAAAHEAFDVLPAELPIHAAIADHLCAAAEELNEPALLRAGRWEAFTAKPTLPRLLDLWEAAGAGDDRAALMRRALQHLQDYLAHPPSRDAVGWRGDDLELPALPSKAALAHACLLAGDLDAAHALAAREQVLGWSNSENTQGLIVPYFLGLASGRSFATLPPNLAQLWQAGLQTGYMTGGAGESVVPTVAAHLRRGAGRSDLEPQHAGSVPGLVPRRGPPTGGEHREQSAPGQLRQSRDAHRRMHRGAATARKRQRRQRFPGNHPHTFSPPQRLPGRIARRNRPDGARQVTVARYHLSHFANTPPTLR